MLESLDMPGFFQTPVSADHYINRAGELYSSKLKRVLKWTIVKPDSNKTVFNMTGGYRVANITVNGKRRGVSRHRLLALTFIPDERDLDTLVVNHINGKPGDDELSNLEWVTYSENTQHAYDNNLHPNKIRSVIVKDLLDDIEFVVPKIKDVAAIVGKSEKRVYGFLFKNSGSRISVRYALKYADKGKWRPYLLRDYSVNKPIKTFNCLTGAILVTNTYREMEYYTGVPADLLQSALDAGREYTKGFIVRRLEDKRPWPKLTEYQKELVAANNERNSAGYLIRDLEGNEEFFTHHSTITSRFDITYAALIKKCSRGKLINDQYTVEKITINI